MSSPLRPVGQGSDRYTRKEKHMSRRTTVLPVLGVALLIVTPRPGPACSLCNANALQTPTIRQEAAQPTARIVVIGTVHDRDKATAASDLHVSHVFRKDPFL